VRCGVRRFSGVEFVRGNRQLVDNRYTFHVSLLQGVDQGEQAVGSLEKLRVDDEPLAAAPCR
jgi:hypothetical protein